MHILGEQTVGAKGEGQRVGWTGSSLPLVWLQLTCLCSFCYYMESQLHVFLFSFQSVSKILPIPGSFPLLVQDTLTSKICDLSQAVLHSSRCLPLRG